MRTSLYSILCIVIRLGAVLLAVQTVVSIPFAVVVSPMGDGALSHAAVVVIAVVSMVLAACLWLFPGALARPAVGRSANQVFESPIDANEIQHIALSVLGVWFAMSALIGMARTGSSFALAWSEWTKGAVRDQYTYRMLIEIALHGVQLVLGIGLAFGSRGLVGLLRRFRERGLPPARYEEAP